MGEGILILEEEKRNPVLALPIVINSLTDGCSFSMVARTEVKLLTSKMEDFEDSRKLLLEFASWLDWWLVTVWGLSNSTKLDDMAKIYCLFITGS